MNFKSFITELQNEVGDDLNLSSSMTNDSVMSLNSDLDSELSMSFSSPESGVQKIRKVLGDYDIEFPALYDLNQEGDEVVFNVGSNYLYIIYSLTENNQYEFFAEVTDEDGLIEILADEGDNEEE